MKAKFTTTVVATGLVAGAVVCLHHGHTARQRQISAPVETRVPAIPAERERPKPQGAAATEKVAVAPPLPGESMMDYLRGKLLEADLPGDRCARLLTLCQGFKREDWPAAMKALKGLGLRADSEELRLLLSAWAAVDPAAAIRSGSSAPEVVLPLWVTADREAAMTWVKSAKTSYQREAYLVIALSALVKSDLSAVGQELSGVEGIDQPYVRRPHDGEKDFEFLKELAPALVELEPERLQQWLDGLSPGVAQHLMPYVIVKLPASRMQEAVAWLEKDPSMIPVLPNRLIFQGWAAEDPDAASACYDSLPPGAVRDMARQGMVERYLWADPPRALELQEGLPPEQYQKELLSWFGLAGMNAPAYAVEQLYRIEDPERRESSLQSLLTHWTERKPEEAKQWMEAHEISKRVLDGLKRTKEATKSVSRP